MNTNYFELSSEVTQAFKNKTPLLALESTVITHGLPFPQNVETALALESIARENKVTPATIAIVNGKIKIGLSEYELFLLAQSNNIFKASVRDIPYLLANNYSAGTTVAATLYCANACGIKVFATGGIGGVHRGNDLDISADLIALSKTPVAVVCAGAKAILDLPRTLEFLETYSVPVIGYRTKNLPAFYSESTSHVLPMWVDDVTTLAEMLNIQWEMGLQSGVLIVNPIPSSDSIAANDIDPVIDAAIKKAALQNISGKNVTPFLLSEVSNATKGKSQQANISLIKNNVLLGAKLAARIKVKDLHQISNEFQKYSQQAVTQ